MVFTTGKWESIIPEGVETNFQHIISHNGTKNEWTYRSVPKGLKENELYKNNIKTAQILFDLKQDFENWLVCEKNNGFSPKQKEMEEYFFMMIKFGFIIPEEIIKKIKEEK